MSPHHRTANRLLRNYARVLLWSWLIAGLGLGLLGSVNQDVRTRLELMAGKQ